MPDTHILNLIEVRLMSEIDEIKSRLDVVDVVSEKVPLQRAGRNYKANCPFHNEKTPSFIVDPGRQSWRCFGSCAIGGDVFSFVMKTENMEFSDALKLLAQRAGVELRGQETSKSRDSYFEINKITQDFYKDSLFTNEAQVARKYLESRGVAQGSVEDFAIGYSPRGGESLKSHLLFHEVDLEKAIECGVINRLNDGRTRDFFWGRLMFPIFDRSGRPVGFGARSLDESMPKYINTPSTPIFDKRSTLYGFHMARDAIRENDLGVIVEGYMDAIAAHEHGHRNVVASMGTALTPQQVRHLKNLAGTFVLALDQDVAGQEATLRSLESAWQIFGESTKRFQDPLFSGNPIKINVVSLPEGKDPDEFIRSDGSDWEKVVDNALPLLEYLIPVVSGRFDLGVPGGKGRVVESLAPIFRLLDPFDKERYIAMLAEKLSSSVETVVTALNQIPRQYSGKTLKKLQNPALHERSNSNIESYREEHTLALILKYPELRDVAADVNPECFTRIEDREIYLKWLELDLEASLVEFIDPVLKERLTKVQAHNILESTTVDLWEDFNFCIRKLESDRLKRYSTNFAESQDDKLPSSEVVNAINDLNKKIMEIDASDR